jgi:ribosomal-protein-alanine N-acetyltransferase
MKKQLPEIPQLESGRITMRKLVLSDAASLTELIKSPKVYRYLPTFLFEKKYADAETVIARLYMECLKQSFILGVFSDGDFCGLAELYGFRDDIHKISLGGRLLEKYWSRGIATEMLRMMIDYLHTETDIEIITASSMIENQASANVLRKNGFMLVVHAAEEDWGYESPTIVDKWIR